MNNLHTNLFFGAVIFLSSLAPQFAFAQATSTPDTNIATTTTETLPTFDPYNSKDVEAKVQSYFADIPVMIAISCALSPGCGPGPWPRY